jgi:hypothetical protein
MDQISLRNIMKNFLALALVALLAACSSTPSERYEKRAYDEQLRQEKITERTVDQAPKWMTQLPESKNAVFATGSSVSRDMSMADWKAKMVAMGKICVAAGGQVSQQGKMFIQDSESYSTEISEMAIKTFCPSIDVTGVEVREVKRVAEGNRYRTYMLVALPTGDANLLQKRKDALAQMQRAKARSTEAFKELDQPVTKP